MQKWKIQKHSSLKKSYPQRTVFENEKKTAADLEFRPQQNAFYEK